MSGTPEPPDGAELELADLTRFLADVKAKLAQSGLPKATRAALLREKADAEARRREVMRPYTEALLIDSHGPHLRCVTVVWGVNGAALR